MVGYAHTWGQHRVLFRKAGDEHVCSLPARWTDLVDPDPFVVLSAGRSLARVEDLLTLAGLVEEWGQARCKVDSAVS